MKNGSSIAIGAIWMLAATCFAPAQSRGVLVPRKPTAPAPAPKSPGPTASRPIAHTATLAAGLPLRIQLNRRYRMHKGTAIVGTLIDPVYSGDHIVLPANTVITGTISRLRPIQRSARTWALLDGDITPLKQPELVFNTLQLPGGARLQMTADATERTAGVVKMTGSQHKQSLFAKGKAMLEAKKKSLKGMAHSKHKSDLALKFVYGQLPYHPQDIWAGTQFDAVLAQPVTLPDPKAGQQIPVTPPSGHIPAGTLNARLETALTSATDKVGNPIDAVLTEPYFDATRTHVILPTGTHLVGVVTQSKHARSLGRNGTLRFTFRQIKLPAGTLQKMHAQMTAVEGAKGQNLTLDSEGGAKANSGPGKFLAPLLLGVLAGYSFDSDANAVESGEYSNGFGIVARVIGIVVVAPPVSAGFAIFAVGKSITRRWLMPGHNVVFAKNTRMELAVSDR